MALTGIVTAQQLQATIDAAPDGVARLATDVRLTPLANDFARQHPEKVQRLGRQQQANSTRPSKTATASTWLWWTEGHSPAVQTLTRQLGSRLRPSVAPRGESGLAQVIADLASAVQRGQVQGGLLFVRSAARAVCFANRCPSLRAMVGTCLETVEQGIHSLGPNVLVIEYPHVNEQTLVAMAQRIVESEPKLPADVQRHLNELSASGCG